jgi:hypothetical protein
VTGRWHNFQYYKRSTCNCRVDSINLIVNKYFRFGFIRRLSKLSDDEIDASANKLIDTYVDDIQPSVNTELRFVASIIRSGYKKDEEVEDDEICFEAKLYKTICSDPTLASSVPNVINLLNIYLSMMVTNCSGERSFSTLKRVKNYLRSTMGQHRLSDLSLLAIEHEILNTLNFDNIIQQFSVLKSRKQSL